MLARKKYIDLNPKIAKIFELKTRNGSFVIARIAGTLSIAKTTSITSITTSATNNGVAAVICLLFTKKCSLSI